MEERAFKKYENEMNGPFMEEREKLKAVPQTLENGPSMMPDWWGSDEEASQSTVAATRQLKVK